MLTQKLHAFIFLLEADPANYALFVNHRPKLVVAYWTLGWQGLYAAWKMAKGLVLFLALKAGRQTP